MAVGIFLAGLDSVDDVIAIRSAIITGNFTTTGGLTTTSWTSEGTTVTKQWAISPMLLLQECNDFIRQNDTGSYGRIIRSTRPYHTNPV